MKRLTALTLIAGVAAALPISTGSADADAISSRECIATIEPSSVLRQADPVTLRAELSEPVGEVEIVTTPDDSGIQVVGLEAEAEVPTVVVDVSEAQVGSWSLAFASEAGVCYGSLDIEA